jgi:hypothetical protein
MLGAMVRQALSCNFMSEHMNLGHQEKLASLLIDAKDCDGMRERRMKRRGFSSVKNHSFGFMIILLD